MCHAHHSTRLSPSRTENPRRGDHQASRGSGLACVQRIGDAERENAVTTLRAAAADGLLDVSELEERLARAWTARTQAELDTITTDLGHWIEQRNQARRRTARARTAHRALRYSTASFLAAMMVMIGTWLLTGAGYPWPIWPAVGWGPWLTAQWLITHSHARHTGSTAHLP